MSIHAVSIDVYCHRDWETGPIYRLYVDGDLLTERNWAWPGYEIYINEHIEVDLEPGEHKITLENCSQHSVINYKNLRVDHTLIHDKFQQESAFST
jgi:hypothetical protein